MSPNAIALQHITGQRQLKQKMNPATSAKEVVLPPDSGCGISTSLTHRLLISVSSKPDDLRNMLLQQFLAFDPLEDCPIEPAQVPLTDEHMLTQKS
jgi:hypothetical protein